MSKAVINNSISPKSSRALNLSAAVFRTLASASWNGRILWNFPQATSIDLQGHNLHGALLAPFETLVPIHVGKRDNNADKYIPVNALWKGRLLHLRGKFGGEQSAARDHLSASVSPA